ncbi:MAG TPA: shikimate dehydrogenase [Ktedonobacterales bacterium]
MPKNIARRVGLIGYPVGHSRSPAIQQAAFDALGINARYELWETQPHDLRKRVDSLRQPEYLGANVTIPFKVDALPYLDSLANSARRLTGAVNTIVRDDTPQGVRLTGHNTDVTALLRVLDEQEVWTAGMRALILGAGGAARAALGAALLREARPWVAARKRNQARAALEALYSRQHDFIASPAPPDVSGAQSHVSSHDAKRQTLAIDDLDALGETLAETNLLINATPVGTRDPLAAPLPIELLRHMPRNAFVMDMVYNPPETALVRAAHAAGLRAIGGFSMLLYQGAESFTLWTGAEAPLGVMRAALEASLRTDG